MQRSLPWGAEKLRPEPGNFYRYLPPNGDLVRERPLEGRMGSRLAVGLLYICNPHETRIHSYRLAPTFAGL